MMASIQYHIVILSMKENFYGMMQTTWTGAGRFMDGYYGKVDFDGPKGNQVECFKVLFEEINKLDDYSR